MGRIFELFLGPALGPGWMTLVPDVDEVRPCLATLRRRGVRIVGAEPDGAPPWSLDLAGPLALLLGGEDKGLSPPLRVRCDAIVGIPLAGDLQSLNLSVAAGVLIFEKVRQEAVRRPDRVDRGDSCPLAGVRSRRSRITDLERAKRG
ncbi:MAG: hypothetical protein JXB39_01865 [Deltaproteobacteria bacterium]|nr:hypothetical protein [Deltaproteobacteria bacterium]